MYKLYWAAETGALAPQIILEEIGSDYERVVIDMEKGEEEQADYLAINPRGQIPALALADGSVVTESAAIVLHLADSHPETRLLPPVASAERAQALLSRCPKLKLLCESVRSRPAVERIWSQHYPQESQA